MKVEQQNQSRGISLRPICKWFCHWNRVGGLLSDFFEGRGLTTTPGRQPLMSMRICIGIDRMIMLTLANVKAPSWEVHFMWRLIWIQIVCLLGSRDYLQLHMVQIRKCYRGCLHGPGNCDCFGARSPLVFQPKRIKLHSDHIRPSRSRAPASGPSYW